MLGQKTVNLYQSAAVEGDRASQNPTVYFPTNFLAGGTVKVAGFVWRDSTNAETEVVASGSGAPLGFIERTINNFNYTVSSEGTLNIVEGGNVTVALRGDFWVKADASVSIGATVYANTTTGAVTFTSGASTVDTGYRALSTGSSGDKVMISNWFDQNTIADLSSYAKKDLSNITGTLGVAHGGTGLSALGTAGQIMKVNSGATALEWAADATE